MGATKRTAKEIAAAIRANVDAYYSDAITHEAFCDRQIALWDEITPRGLRFERLVMKAMGALA